MNNTVKKLLENKFRNCKIGGTRRKKLIRRKRKHTFHKTKLDINIERNIKIINKKIKEIDDNDDFEKMVIYLRQLLIDWVLDLKKYDITKKFPFTIKEMKQKGIQYIIKNFVINKNKKFVEFNENLVIFLKINFTYDGCQVFGDFFDTLLNVLNNEDYLENKEKYSRDDILEAYREFNFKPFDKINYKHLRKQYKNLSLLNHPDKHIDDKEKYQLIFTKIKKYYNTLLYYYKKKSWDT